MNPSLPPKFHHSSRRCTSLSARGALPGIRTLEDEKAWVRQICRADLDARSAVPSNSEECAAVPRREQFLAPPITFLAAPSRGF